VVDVPTEPTDVDATGATRPKIHGCLQGVDRCRPHGHARKGDEEIRATR